MMMIIEIIVVNVIIMFCNDFSQEIARGKGSGNENDITLDVHAIDKLQKEFNLKCTDDSAKYKYTSDEDGSYGEHFFPSRR